MFTPRGGHHAAAVAEQSLVDGFWGVLYTS
jgi:hypothetical protein